MDTKPSSLAWRATQALLLTIGFYGLAILVAVVLLLIPIAMYYYLERINVRIALACWVGAGAILWSILPRIDRFVPPGPRIDGQSQPRLLSLIQEIAAKTGQPMPVDVYVVADVNAFVAERGGWMGIGSKRVMGVGLALLQTLSVAELRAVVAHEFGHYYSGDTKLTPWVYKTRMSIGRTISSLGKSWLSFLFTQYGMMFLRITQGVSRAQEFQADQLAAQVAGRQAALSSLKKVHGAGEAFEVYWVQEYAPALKAGFRPPLLEGFAMFTGLEAIEEAMQNSVGRQMESSETNKFDSHPSLHDRLAALEGLPEAVALVDDRPASDLLNAPEALEERLVALLVRANKLGALQAIAWQEVGARVYLPTWTKLVPQFSASLKDVTLAGLPAFLRSPGPLVAQIRQSVKGEASREVIQRGILQITGVALSVALANQGWTVSALPGKDMILSHGDQTLEPFKVVSQLESGEMKEADWQSICLQAGIGEVHLA